MPKRGFEPGVLHAFASRVLHRLGAPDGHANRVGNSLVDSNLVGHDSHGVALLPYYEELIAEGDVQVSAVPEVIAETAALTLIDGHKAFGQVTGETATRLAVALARSNGVGFVSARNAAHLGRLGEYTEAIAREGLIGALLVNFQGGDQRVAPYGGIDRRLTNNPISLGAPGPDGPIVLDMALSTIAEAKVWLAHARGDSVPEGAIIDPHGEASTNPEDFDRGGALLPIAGHKGYGLIVLVELIVGALTGGGMCSPSEPRFSNAFVLITMDPRLVSDEAEYADQVVTLATHIRSTRLAPGFSEILLPGELELKTRRTRQRGGIPIDDNTLSTLNEQAKRLRVQGLDAPNG